MLGGAAGVPALAAFMARMEAVITLHSPHLGTSLATLASAVNTMAARIQALIAAIALAPIPQLATLRAFVGDPAIAELAPGSPTLAAIAAAEPVPDIAFHTSGGSSTVLLRMWQRAYTFDSYLPLPLPLPLFHWGIAPVPVGFPFDAATFIPSQVLLPLPLMTEAIALMGALTAQAAEITDGSGDFLVADAMAHLSFSTSRTANALNHAEALWDPTLQSQVIPILAGLKIILPSHKARAVLTPFPALQDPAEHFVRAADVSTGADVLGTVSVIDTNGHEVLSARTGDAGFTFGFQPTTKHIRVFDPETRQWTFETIEVFPTIRIKFDDTSFTLISVDIGLWKKFRY